MTRVRSELDRTVRLVSHSWIPMTDGCRLAARLWLPEDAEAHPVPAVVEYVPYRKNDGLALRDAPIHAYFAGHGYASVRVDMRGSGDSDGILLDEYLPQEQADGLQVLRWLAAQPWCTGRVGIIGKSWGGFNGLQIAAHAPAELGAVISVASTDDRYADDVHYMGGAMLAVDQLPWASAMLALNGTPPDPEVVGDGWREAWLQRLAETPPFVEEWVRHQRRDGYWAQGSVCEDYAALRCPVYMVGGWADAYRSAILRFLAGYPGPCKGLIGPWAHLYPESGTPGPAIGFLQEAVRWWDRWLKDEDNGITGEPKLRVYVPDAMRPDPGIASRPGRWVALDGWPSPAVSHADQALGVEDEVVVSSPQALRSDPGVWCPHGGPNDLPEDQRAADGQSRCFDLPVLADAVEILGVPTVHLEVSADRPLALVAVRLCDVWPDGASTLVSVGVLNLTHRAGHAHPEPLTPGERYRIAVPLTAIGYALPAGHRLRVAVSTAYWPWIWPSPERVSLTLHPGPATRLELPVLAPGTPDHEPPGHFGQPEEAVAPAHEMLHPGSSSREASFDVGTGRSRVVARTEAPLVRFSADGLEYGERSEDTFEIVEGDPLSATVRSEREVTVARGAWRTAVRSTSTMSATASTFQLTNVVEAYEDADRVFASARSVEVPRDLV
ncbi:MAG: CocE/NonD family hydrolase [Acidimicrobiales bacterium]